MRQPEEMYEMMVGVARRDENIRGVIMTGSRANPDCPKDSYQDFDIIYMVKDMKPYWDNMEWVCEKFGKPALMQKPESMKLIAPDGDGSFVYLMLFPDGNRIDLKLTTEVYRGNGEPAVVLPEDIYKRFEQTYTDASYEHMWEASFEMLSLFGDVARSVGKSLSFVYDEEEETGIEQYMRQVRKAWKEES